MYDGGSSSTSLLAAPASGTAPPWDVVSTALGGSATLRFASNGSGAFVGRPAGGDGPTASRYML
jgi:hypothetical protein